MRRNIKSIKSKYDKKYARNSIIDNYENPIDERVGSETGDGTKTAVIEERIKTPLRNKD